MYAANYDQYKRDMAAYKAGGKVDEDHELTSDIKLELL
jgi:hypothetical protein